MCLPFLSCNGIHSRSLQIVDWSQINCVIIKSEGSWSTKLYQMLSSSPLIDRLDVSIEGPYGPASNHFLRHEKLVMVSGGSGITPFISIIREIIFSSKTCECKTPDIILIAVFRSSLDLTMLDLLLPMTGSPSELSNPQLQIDAYVTREKKPTTDNSKRVRSIWFKPYQTDIPMAAILGPNSWPWLAAIISSSFIIFVILIGIITCYHINPIEHKKNEFSNSQKAVLNLLVICVSIAATASAAVFWNKRQYAREVKQIQNLEGETPEGSPNLNSYNADREMESLPHQSLAEATRIHYGERPDLKRMLFEYKGSSIGVLVSGPKKLRHDVAALCVRLAWLIICILSLSVSAGDHRFETNCLKACSGRMLALGRYVVVVRQLTPSYCSALIRSYRFLSSFLNGYDL